MPGQMRFSSSSVSAGLLPASVISLTFALCSSVNLLSVGCWLRSSEGPWLCSAFSVETFHTPSFRTTASIRNGQPSKRLSLLFLFLCSGVRFRLFSYCPPRSHFSQRRLKRERAMTIAYPCWAAHCFADSSSSSRLLYWLGGRGAIEFVGGGEISGEMGIWSSGDPGLRTPNMTKI